MTQNYELGRDGLCQMTLLYSEFDFKPGYIKNWSSGQEALHGDQASPDSRVRKHMFSLSEAFRLDTDINPRDVARVSVDFDYTNGGYAVIKVWYRHPSARY